MPSDRLSDWTTSWLCMVPAAFLLGHSVLCSPSSPPLFLCRSLIDKDVSIPPETFRKHVDASLTYINRGLKQMSRLFLVEDLVDSLKVSNSSLCHCPLSSRVLTVYLLPMEY